MVLTTDRRSTAGYFFKLGMSGGAVSWQTKKQNTVVLSSCKTEDRGLASAVQEATSDAQEIQTYGQKISLRSRESLKLNS